MLPGETLWAQHSYTLFVMVTSEYQHKIRRARIASTLTIPAFSPVIPAKAGIHRTRISTTSTTTDLPDNL